MMPASALPSRYNFTIWRGQTWTTHITVLQGDIGSQPRDLTNYTAVMTITQAGGPILTLTNANGITLGGTAGTIDLYIAAANTTNFSWSRASYELMVTNTAVNPPFADPLLAGKILVQASN